MHPLRQTTHNLVDINTVTRKMTHRKEEKKGRWYLKLQCFTRNEL